MAKSKAVIATLATATALAGTIDNAELNASIEALEKEEDANGNTQEHKDLKDLLEAIEAQADESGANGANGANGGADEDAKKEKSKKYNYDGVRMVGSKWYCKKDNYKKGFGTADECAEHFNG